MSKPISQCILNVKSARGGDHESCGREPVVDIATVYTKYHRRVFAWCWRIVRNGEDAEDLTQEAFLHIICKIHTFRGKASLSTWLHRVVINTALMWLRRKRLPQTSSDEILDSGEEPLWRRGSMRVADATLRDSPARIDLKRAINQLPEGFKAALLLHDVEDYQHPEIAERLGWSIGTSKSQLHKARRRLRELLSGTREDRGSRGVQRRSVDNCAITSQPTGRHQIAQQIPGREVIPFRKRGKNATGSLGRHFLGSHGSSSRPPRTRQEANGNDTS